jgi:hypothetical protein
MSIKQQSDAEAQAARDNANRTLETLVALVRDEHKDRSERGEVGIIQAIRDVTADEIMALPAYRQLHEVCASADVNRKIELDPLRWFNFGSAPGVIITLDMPNDESPYASMPKVRPAAPARRNSADIRKRNGYSF